MTLPCHVSIACYRYLDYLKKFNFKKKLSIFIQNRNSSSQLKEFVKLFRKIKIKPIILIKMDFLIQIVIVSCSDFLKKVGFWWM